MLCHKTPGACKEQLNMLILTTFFFLCSRKRSLSCLMLFLISSPHTSDQDRISISRVSVLPFRGFSSASANQMMKKNKNVDFIFFTCAWLSPQRAINMFLQDRNCRTVWNKDEKKFSTFFFSVNRWRLLQEMKRHINTCWLIWSITDQIQQYPKNTRYLQ